MQSFQNKHVIQFEHCVMFDTWKFMQIHLKLGKFSGKILCLSIHLM
jgi:hypothetical protein